MDFDGGVLRYLWR